MNNESMYYVIFFLWIMGLIAILYGGHQHLKWRRRRRFFLQEEGKEVTKSRIPHTWTEGMRKEIVTRVDYAGLKITFRLFIIISVLSASIGVLIGLFYFNNLSASLPLAGGLGLIPWVYLNYAALKKQLILEQQLLSAIQFFISQYNSLHNVTASLSIIKDRLENPLREEIALLLREMNSGISREKALFSFAQRINSHWAYRFAHIVNLCLIKGIPISGMLFSLYTDMKLNLIKEKERRMESMGVKAESYLLYLFIPVMYLLACKINPQAHLLLTQTPAGKRTTFVLFSMLLIGVITTIRLGKVKVR